MHNQTSVTFAGGNLNRAAHLRAEAHQSDLKSHPDAKAVPIWRGKPLVDLQDNPTLAWVPMDAAILDEAKSAPIFLGLHNESPRFAYDISPWAPENFDIESAKTFLDDTHTHHPSLPDTHKFIDLRMMMVELPHLDAGDAATAKGIFEWHKSHQYCANCGEPSVVSEAGWQRTCPSCNTHHFPRTDPVVIMLVTHGNDTLLGRSPQWPEAMYSCLAGFMEPGEDIEEAVRREVFEECGVSVGRVSYHSSQPWPFPSSLMIGCVAEAIDTELTLDPKEIEDARWISRETVANAFMGNDPTLLPARKGSLAHHLLHSWLTDTVEK